MKRVLELVGVFAFIAGSVAIGLVLSVANVSPAVAR